LLLFGVVFEGGVGLVVTFGVFLHFAVRVYLVAFPEIAHAFNASHELLSLVVIVSLGKYVDDLFSKIRNYLKFLVFLLSQQVTIPFPLDSKFLIQFMHIETELLDNFGIFRFLIFQINRRHVIITPGSQQIHELDGFS
jgi:hypothetical protein